MRRPRPLRRARGFTLVELLIASALLAILAVLSWRGLDAVLLARQRIAAASDELRALTLAFAQLDEDLRRSWPVRLLGLDPPSIGFSVHGDEVTPTLELLREVTTAAQPTQLQRVAWRLRDGVLERGFGAWVPPQSRDPSTSLAAARAGVGGDAGPGSDAGVPPGTLVWQPVLANVASLEMLAWQSRRGWVEARSLAGQLRGPGAVPPAGVVGGPGGPGAQPGGFAGAAAAAAARAGGGGAGSGAPGTVGGAGTPDGAAGFSTLPVTGLQLRVVRTDGTVLSRVFPVMD